ncbi:MAG: hypothetical protein ACTHJS_15080 [Xanthobacteraceae bacterium]
MADQREKTVSYRRAAWLPEVSGITLESCIRDAHFNLKTIDERTIGFGGRLTRSAKQKNATPSGMFIHLTTETPGDATSIVPHPKPREQELDLRVQAPPADGEWLEGDAFLYVRNDHVCMCSTDIRDGAINFFSHEFFKKAKLRRDSALFELQKIADVSKLKFLHSQGVKELEIHAMLYKATAEHTKRKTEVIGSLGAVGKYLKAVLGKPFDVTPDAIKVGVSLKVDRRFRKELSVGYKTIENLAANVVSHSEKNDDYSILTKSGQRISPDEIFIRTKVRIDKEGNTIDRDKAWRELQYFYESLKRSGALEE